MKGPLLGFILIALLAIMPATAANWTIMVYMDGDNNLEDYAIKDFLEIASVGSTKDVNIIVLLDRIEGYNDSYGDWSGAKIFYIVQGMTPDANAVDLGEVNMGDPQTLIDFVNWSVSNYPAEHYALIIWDHGSGWKLGQTLPPIKGVCVDDTNNDYLTSSELQSALSQIKLIIGRDLDIIGFDACLMGMEEVDYLINASMPSAIRVGSEEVEFAPGWPYKMILQNLTANPSMTPEELAIEIVNDYYNYYSALASILPFFGITTLSAVYVNNTIDEAINDFVKAVMDAQDYGAVAEARYRVEEFYYSDYIDLYNFTQLIKTYSSNETVKDAATRLMDAINSSVIAEKHSSLHPNVHGLSIYFPATQLEYDYWNSILPEPYEYLKFASDTQWDEFLKWFYSMPKPIIILEGTKHIAEGDVAVFKGSVYGADSANWSLVGPYNMSAGNYTNQPLSKLHHFVIMINTTDLITNYNAMVGNYDLKISAGNTELSFMFEIDYPEISVNINDTNPELGQVIEISGSTNVAPTGSIYDDETPNNISIFVDPDYFYQPEPDYVLDVPDNQTFRILFRIPENWSYGFHTFKVVVYTNKYFHGESYGWIEIINPEWQNIDVLNTTEIRVTRDEVIRLHGKTNKDWVYIYADNVSVFYDVNELPSNESFDVYEYPSLAVPVGFVVNNTFVAYLHVSPTAPLGRHTLYVFATNNTTINRQTDLLARIDVTVHSKITINFTVYPNVVNITNPLNIEAEVSGIDLKAVRFIIADLSNHLILGTVSNTTGISGHYSLSPFPGSWKPYAVYLNDEPVTVIINQSIAKRLFVPAYYRNSTLGWTMASLDLNYTTLEVEWIWLNLSGDWIPTKPSDGEVKIVLFRINSNDRVYKENGSIYDVKSLKFERRVVRDGKYLVVILAEDMAGNRASVNTTILVDNSRVKLPPLPGLIRSPKDLNEDGIIEDFNGNGRLDFDDVVKLYKNMKWIRQNYPLNRVDQNDDNRLDFDDVVKLFERI